MKLVITATELKKNLGAYLDRAMDNKDTFITKNGREIARLAPIIYDINTYDQVKEEAESYNTKKVSYEEFMTIYENTDKRLEYLDGEIFLMSSPTVTHQQIVGEIFFIFKVFFTKKACTPFIAPFDVHFNKKNVKTPDVLQPDVLIACDTDKLNKKDKYMGTPSLVVEVLSKSTRNYDMVRKLNTYMASGVKEYWIVDSIKEQVILYVFSEREIDTVMSYSKEDTVKSSAFSELEVVVNDIFS